MKLTLVVHQFLPRFFTGTEQYVCATARAMQARGWDVHVIAMEPDFSHRGAEFSVVREEVEGLPVSRIRYCDFAERDFCRMEMDHPLVGAHVAQLLRERRPDVVHFFHVRFMGADLIAEARAQAIPSVVHLMDFWFLCPATILRRSDGSVCDGPPDGGMGCIACMRPDLDRELRAQQIESELRELAMLKPPALAPRLNATQPALDLVNRLERLREALLKTDRIIAPSRFLHSMFVKNGYPPSRIEIIQYGIDEDRLGGVRFSPREPGPLRCAFFGTIGEYKGTDLAVDAVLHSGADILLTVHGRTSDFADYSGPLMERSKSDPRIRWPGPFRREQLGAVLNEVDVLIVPSRWHENTPLSAMEAFYFGVPVIAADLGGMSELIVDGENGELFRPGDAADLRRRLERLASEPERLGRYRKAIRKPKSMADNAAEFEAIYRQLTGAAIHADTGAHR